MTDGFGSLENRRLLNPAFCGVVISNTAIAYTSVFDRGLPLLYSYLVIPMVFHRETRHRLPASLATKLVTWTERNSDVLTGLAERVQQLASFTSRGVLAATTGGLATLDEDAAIRPSVEEKVLKGYGSKSGSTEIQEILKKSTLLGKWLASAGTPATTFTVLGIRLENNT